MTGRGKYQKQLAGLVAAAKAEYLPFNDILPDELKEHFHEMAELEQTRQYVKELEEREQKLQAGQDTLSKELNKKQTEIDNLPAEYEAMKLDLHQAQRQIALYKETSEDLAKRVKRYRDQLDDIVEKKQANASAVEKIENLRTQVEDQQAFIDKLIDDNHKSEALSEQLRTSDVKALERKDKELAKKDELIAELRQQIQYAQGTRTVHEYFDFESCNDTADTKALVEAFPDNSFALQEQNIDLLQQNLSLSQDNEALQDQHVIMKTQLFELTAFCNCAIIRDCKAQLFAAAISEIKTLNRFYKAAFNVLNNLTTAFHAAKTDIPSPHYIEDQLDAAQEALAGYNSVKKVVRAVTDVSGIDIDQVALCKELDSLGLSAANSMSSLELLSTGIWRFLNQLSDDPKLVSQLNGALCDAGQVRVVDFYSCD